MTTLTYRDGTLCSDSASTIGAKWFAAVRKLAQAKDGTIGGGAGTTVAVTGFLQWIDEGAAGEPGIEDENFSGLLVRPDGSVWLAESSGPLTRLEAPFHAIGSGREIAVGAMAAGATAERAVQIACRFDGASREPVQTMRLSEERPDLDRLAVTAAQQFA